MEQGCTMLASHHECGAPLFRCRGEILCPVCSSETIEPLAKLVGESSNIISAKGDATRIIDGHRAGNGEDLDLKMADKSISKELKENDLQRQIYSEKDALKCTLDSGASSQDNDFEMTEQAIRKAILYRLRVLAADIREEQDLSRLKSQLDCVDAALKVLRALEVEI